MSLYALYFSFFKIDMPKFGQLGIMSIQKVCKFPLNYVPSLLES